MFKKMKRNFLILNMAIITILLAIAFGSIFIAMSNNVNISIKSDLNIIENQYKNYVYANGVQVNQKGPSPYINSPYYFVSDNSGSFQIDFQKETNYDNTKLKKDLTTIVMALKNPSGNFTYDNVMYAYNKSNFSNNNNHKFGRIVVMDISKKTQVINELKLNLFLVGGAMLVLIFFISNFFTNKSIKPIENAFNKQRQFISDASHELKTPLAVMKTNLDIVTENPESKVVEQEKWLNYTKNEITGMSNLINQLLFLARVDQIKEIDTFEKVNFSDMVNKVILSMEVIAFEKNINIQDEIAQNIFVNGNYDELKRLIVILFDNAIKYCNNGGTIIISLKNENGNGVFLISNSGVIIEKNQCQAVFERFYRANKERERQSGSYGLGLSIAKSTADKHGFNIKAYPENNMTNFKVILKIIKKEIEKNKN